MYPSFINFILTLVICTGAHASQRDTFQENDSVKPNFPAFNHSQEDPTLKIIYKLGKNGPYLNGEQLKKLLENGKPEGQSVILRLNWAQFIEKEKYQELLTSDNNLNPKLNLKDHKDQDIDPLECLLFLSKLMVSKY